MFEIISKNPEIVYFTLFYSFHLLATGEKRREAGNK